jgi:hypothetical protein
MSLKAGELVHLVMALEQDHWVAFCKKAVKRLVLVIMPRHGPCARSRGLAGGYEADLAQW